MRSLNKRTRIVEDQGLNSKEFKLNRRNCLRVMIGMTFLFYSRFDTEWKQVEIFSIRHGGEQWGACIELLREGAFSTYTKAKLCGE